MIFRGHMYYNSDRQVLTMDMLERPFCYWRLTYCLGWKDKDKYCGIAARLIISAMYSSSAELASRKLRVAFIHPDLGIGM